MRPVKYEGSPPVPADYKRLADEVLGKYFRSSNLKSFTRQLQFYNFKRKNYDPSVPRIANVGAGGSARGGFIGRFHRAVSWAPRARRIDDTPTCGAMKPDVMGSAGFGVPGRSFQLACLGTGDPWSAMRW